VNRGFAVNSFRGFRGGAFAGGARPWWGGGFGRSWWNRGWGFGRGSWNGYWPGYGLASSLLWSAFDWPWYGYGAGYGGYPVYYYSQPVYYYSPVYDYISTSAAQPMPYSTDVYGSPRVVPGPSGPTQGDPGALPYPRPAPNGTYPYDGGPRNPVPMPKAEPAPTGVPPGTAAPGARVVSLPTQPARIAYAAYGEEKLDRIAPIKARVFRVNLDALRDLDD
jgi:hypothetical protein